MNLVPIKDYEDLYSFDLNSNQVYSHYKKDYKKMNVNKLGYHTLGLWKNNKVKTSLLHRLVYEAYKGEIPQGYCIDHIDNNPTNNHIDNLRLATISQNSHNTKVYKTNKSTGYKNITIRKEDNYIYYKVHITKNYKLLYCKNFKTLEEAITNRDIQLKLIHGEFYNLG